MTERMIMITVALGLLMLGSCSTSPPGFEETEAETYLHVLSGVEFAHALNSFGISSVKSNDPWGMDVSVTYSIYTPARAYVTITLYPVANGFDSIETEFSRLCLEISKLHPHAFEYDVPQVSISSITQGKLLAAAYSYIRSVGGNPEGVMHILHLHERKQWYIKYEYIIPGKQEELSTSEGFESFIKHLYTLPVVEPELEPPLLE